MNIVMDIIFYGTLAVTGIAVVAEFVRIGCEARRVRKAERELFEAIRDLKERRNAITFDYL